MELQAILPKLGVVGAGVSGSFAPGADRGQARCGAGDASGCRKRTWLIERAAWSMLA